MRKKVNTTIPGEVMRTLKRTICDRRGRGIKIWVGRKTLREEEITAADGRHSVKLDYSCNTAIKLPLLDISSDSM